MTRARNFTIKAETDVSEIARHLVRSGYQTLKIVPRTNDADGCIHLRSGFSVVVSSDCIMLEHWNHFTSAHTTYQIRKTVNFLLKDMANANVPKGQET